ncbi:MAG: DUF3378 domain-containing protein [Mycoplasmoidaceae bacterium]|nr:DUF3378 domain-containing protein [Mycoplasmoidaceae bacterium]
MVSFTKQLTQRQFEFIKSKLNKYKIATKSEYIVFAAEYLETKINIYNSLKIVVQGKNVEKVLEFLTIKVNKPEVIDETSCSYIGCDETGNGNYFGGVYCVAAYVHKDSVARLKELGISDSKNYTDEQIIKIMNNLRKVAKKEHIIMSYNCQ